MVRPLCVSKDRQVELQKLRFSFYLVKMFLIDHHLGNERLKRCRAEKGA